MQNQQKVEGIFAGDYGSSFRPGDYLEHRQHGEGDDGYLPGGWKENTYG